MNGAARNAEGLPWPDVDRFAVVGPGRHALEAVDRLFVMIVSFRSNDGRNRTRHSGHSTGDANAGPSENRWLHAGHLTSFKGIHRWGRGRKRRTVRKPQEFAEENSGVAFSRVVQRICQ